MCQNGFDEIYIFRRATIIIYSLMQKKIKIL